MTTNQTLQYHRLEEYATMLEEEGYPLHRTRDENPLIEYISYDSRDIKKNTLFLCKGNAFRREYLLEAIQKGACAYIAAQEMHVPIPGLIVDSIRPAVSYASRMYFNHPEKYLHFIAITGTKGKSTTVFLLKEIFNCHFSSLHLPPVGLISSIENFDGKQSVPSQLTTPEPIELFSHLHRCVKNGVTHVIMETSSQALKYGRTVGLQFDYAGFLNIAEDHISPIEHPNFEDYFSSKLSMFQQAKIGVLNQHCDFFSRILEASKVCQRRLVVQPQSSENLPDGMAFPMDSCNTWKLMDAHSEKEGIEFSVEHQNQQESFFLPLHGLFNIENAMIAIAIASDFGITSQHIREGLAHSVVSGRMEQYVDPKNRFMVLVDFAHNGLSFTRVFEAMKAAHPEARQVAVFGTVGNKAQNRRKEMGLSAGAHLDFCYLTQDDNDWERIEDINQEIAQYLNHSHCPYEEILDRSQAIEQAIHDAIAYYEKHHIRSVVMILGKGDEQRMRVNGEYLPYPSDQKIVQTCLQNLNS